MNRFYRNAIAASSLADNEVFKQTCHFGFQDRRVTEDLRYSLCLNCRHVRNEHTLKWIRDPLGLLSRKFYVAYPEKHGPSDKVWLIISFLFWENGVVYCELYFRRFGKPFCLHPHFALKVDILRLFETSKIQHTSKQCLSKK